MPRPCTCWALRQSSAGSGSGSCAAGLCALFPAGRQVCRSQHWPRADGARARGSGLGHALMDRAVTALCTQWGAQPIRIGAQAQLEGFYAAHGFVDVGRPYIEDGIAHLEMLRRPDFTAD